MRASLASILALVGLTSSALAQPASLAAPEPAEEIDAEWTQTLTPTRRSNAKMVGGTEARPGEWPFFASLRGEKPLRVVHACGATMISPEWAMTAAHCLHDVQRNAAGDLVRTGFGRLQLVIGQHDLTETDASNIFDVVDARVHPDYVRELPARSFEEFGGPQNDIALLKIDRPWAGPVARLSATIESDPDAIFGRGFVAGFGLQSGGAQLRQFDIPRTERVGFAGSTQLLHAMVPLKSPDRCAELYGGTARAYDQTGTLCAGFDDGGIDSCQGDSGGPIAGLDLEGRAYQIGVVSYGWGCAEAGKPGVYTRVSHHAEWIKSVTPDAKFVAANPETAITLSQDSLQALYSEFSESEDTIEIALVPGSTVRVRDEIHIELIPSISGRLYLLDRSADGTLSVIYPNQFVSASDTLVRAGEMVRIPEDFDFIATLNDPSVTVERNELIAIILPPDVELIGDSIPEISKGLQPEAQKSDYAIRLQKALALAARDAETSESRATGRLPYTILGD